MHRLIFFLITSLLFFGRLSAQLYPIKQNGRWGAINYQAQIVIPPEYDFLRYSETSDRLLVSKKSQYGLLDSKGKVIIPINFDYLKIVKNGLVYSLKNGAWGVFSASGETILKPEFRRIQILNQDLFRTYKLEGYGLASRTGNIILKNRYNTIELSEDKCTIKFQDKDRWGLVSAKGHPIMAAEASDLSFEENYVIAYLPNKKIKVINLKADSLLNTNLYPNRVAWNLEKKRREKRIASQKIAANPSLKEARWQRFNTHYQLVNGLYQPLIPYKFYDIIKDSDGKKSLARYFNQDNQTFECFYIDLTQSKILWRVPAKFVAINDFDKNNWARVTIDTLFDGLIDKTGKIVRYIQSQGQNLEFKDMGEFREGLAWIYDGKKYGYVNSKHQLIVPFILDRASNFENELAIVAYNNNFGCLDKTGKTVLKYIYQGITKPSEGLICVKKGKGKNGLWGAVNLKGETIIPHIYTALRPFKNAKAKAQKDGKYWGIIDKNNKVIVPLKIACSKLADFKNGIAAIFQVDTAGKTTMGYADTKANFIIPPEYDYIENFDSIWNLKHGLTKIWKGDCFGYIDYKGRPITGAVFSDMGNFQDNWGKNRKNSRAKIGDLYGLLDHNGDTILPFRYCYLGDNFEDVWQGKGFLKACLYDKFGYIKKDGKEIISFNYDYVSDITTGYILVKKANKWGLIDTLEDVSITLDYDKIDLISKSSNLIRLAKDKPTYYYYDKNGKLTRFVEVDKALLKQKPKKQDLLYSPNYEHVTPFDADGLAVIRKEVKKSNLKAILSKNGKLLSKYIYIDLGPFKEGLAFAKLYNKKDRASEKYGFIDKNQTFAIPAQYTAAKNFSEGLAAVAKGGKWGYIDKTGKIVIPLQYDRVTAFEGGYALVDNTKIIDQTGQYLGRLEYAHRLKATFKYDRAIAEVKGFERHIRPDGLPAYNAFYDEVTPFLKDVAFVKKGELWALKRETPTGMRKLKFNKQQKIIYLEKYGSKRQYKNKYGNYFVDKGWEKISDGKWRLINKDGQFINDFIFDSLEPTEEGYRVKLTRFYGISKLDGTFLTELDYPVLRRLDGLLKLESKNKLGYLKLDGTWLWEPTD